MSENTKQIQNLKKCVKTMIAVRQKSTGTNGEISTPTEIWQEVLKIYTYALNLSADDYQNIRFHTGLITGENTFQYWHAYPPINPEIFADNIGYKFFTDDLPEAYWLSEPASLTFPKIVGVSYRGKVINANICRYQSCVTNLYLMGILDILLGNKHNIIFEIGGGYGGLAHGLGNILSHNSTYVILDMPEMLLFSGGYLIVNNPEKKIYIYDQRNFSKEFLKTNIINYHYVLLPNTALNELYDLPEINLMINMQSFQEMSRQQIRNYLDFGNSKPAGYIYSDNIDCHPFNHDLLPETVTSLLEARFKLFPNPYFYNNKNFKDCHEPWFYKCYVGVPKNANYHFPSCGAMKLLRNKRYVLQYRNGQISFTCERNWENDLLSLMKIFYRKIRPVK